MLELVTLQLCPIFRSHFHFCQYSKSLVFDKIPTCHQNQWVVSANVNNHFGRILILSQTLGSTIMTFKILLIPVQNRFHMSGLKQRTSIVCFSVLSCASLFVRKASAMKIQTFLYFVKQKPAPQLEICCTSFMADCHTQVLLGSYYTYCSDFWWIILFIFITVLPFCPIICTVLKKAYCTVNFYYCTALPIIGTVLKNQACNMTFL